MKIAFFWTWEFSKNILKNILESKNSLEVKLIVSQADKPIWRKKEIIPTPVKTLALEKNIEILQPEKLKNNKDFFEKLKSLDLDFIVVVAYGKIIPKDILDIPKFSCINIHGSLLPLYRWASPIQESIKNWDKKTWLTIMYMSEWMDEWDMLAKKEVNIDILDKTPDIFRKFEEFWAELLIKTLEKIISGELKWEKQDDSKATYCWKIDKKDGELDFKNQTAKEIYDRFRAYYPWPWIYSFYNWKKILIEDCFFEENIAENISLWKVFELKDEQNPKNLKICIKCNSWALILKKVKLEWKKSLDIKDFFNWNKDFLEYNF